MHFVFMTVSLIELRSTEAKQRLDESANIANVTESAFFSFMMFFLLYKTQNLLHVPNPLDTGFLYSLYHTVSHERPVINDR